MAKTPRDPSDIPDDEITKPQKPKKAFEVTITIWDDADLTMRLVEFIKKERGAPEKWMRKPDQFNASVKDKISSDPLLVVEKIAEGFNIKLSELLKPREKKAD
jgi:hypothetical protein